MDKKQLQQHILNTFEEHNIGRVEAMAIIAEVINTLHDKELERARKHPDQKKLV